MNKSRRPPWKKKPFVVDSTPETLPGDFQFQETLPADFVFDDQPAAQTPAPHRETSWVEAAFPRSSASAELPVWAPQSLASAAQDFASLPGRTLASLVGPDGESFSESMARTEGSPRAAERGMLPGQQASETILRDPVTGVLAALPAAWIPARLLASTGRGAALARGTMAGAEMGGLVAGSRQAENVAAGKGIKPEEIPVDIGIGAGLGAGGQALGSGLRYLGGKTVNAAMQLAKVGKKYRDGVESALPEMIQRGMLRPTVRGMEDRAAQMEAEIGAKYQAAKAGTENIPAIPIRMFGAQAAQDATALADRGLIGPADEFAATNWIMEHAYRPLPAGAAASPAMVDVPTAIASRSMARKTAGSYESAAPQSVRREVMQDVADKYAQLINDRMAVVSPSVRAVDQFAAPYYQTRPYMEALGNRGNNYGIGLSELMAGGIGANVGAPGGAVSSMGSALGLGALARLQRSPAYPFLLNEAGKAGSAISRKAGTGSRLGLGLRGSSTDNAR